MNEMDELSRFRAEVPDRGTARVEEIFRAALALTRSSTPSVNDSVTGSAPVLASARYSPISARR